MTTVTKDRIGRRLGLFWRGRQGSSAAEFALVLPILALLLFGTIEVGRALHDYQLVDKSVRHAARYLSRISLVCPPTGAGLFDPLDKNIAKNLALSGGTSNPTGSGDYLLAYWTDKTTIVITPDCKANTGTFKSMYDGIDVPTVTVVATVPIFLQFGSTWLANMSVNVVVRHEEVVLGG